MPINESIGEMTKKGGDIMQDNAKVALAIKPWWTRPLPYQDLWKRM